MNSIDRQTPPVWGADLPPAVVACVSMALVVAVAGIDLLTGEELSFFVFYFVPVSFAAWKGNPRMAAACALACTAAWLGVEKLSGHKYSHGGLLAANLLIRWVSYTVMGRFVSNLKASREALNKHAERLEHEVARRTAQLQERVGELEMFSYSVSHNLRAPLRAIEGNSSFVAERVGNAGAEVADALDRIGGAAVRMDRLIMSLVEYVQLTLASPELRPVAVGPILREVLDAQRAAIQRLGAQVDVEQQFPFVRGDNRLIHTIFRNLVGNSLQFVRAEGPPRVAVSWREVRPGVARFEVSDNGPGIPPRFHQLIFGPFEQLQSHAEYPESAGMGLTVAQKCASKLKGKVGVKSDGATGSTFWVELALHNPPSQNGD